MSGQDVGYDIGTDGVLRGFLHADYVQDDVALGGVIGVAANPVGRGLHLRDQGRKRGEQPGVSVRDRPVGSAQAAFVYDPAVSGACGERVQAGRQRSRG